MHFVQNGGLSSSSSVPHIVLHCSFFLRGCWIEQENRCGCRRNRMKFGQIERSMLYTFLRHSLISLGVLILRLESNCIPLCSSALQMRMIPSMYAAPLCPEVAASRRRSNPVFASFEVRV